MNRVEELIEQLCSNGTWFIEYHYPSGVLCGQTDERRMNDCQKHTTCSKNIQPALPDTPAKYT